MWTAIPICLNRLEPCTITMNAFRLWRLRHVVMVEHQISDKPGTGGSTGVRYLQSTFGKRFFPELWEVRSQL